MVGCLLGFARLLVCSFVVCLGVVVGVVVSSCGCIPGRFGAHAESKTLQSFFPARQIVEIALFSNYVIV